MVERGGCFKRQSPLANQAALVEAASARLGIAEPRVVPCAAQTSEQYRYVSHRPRPPLPLLHLQRHPHNFPARAFASALLPLSLCLLPRPCHPFSFSAARWRGRKKQFRCLNFSSACALQPAASQVSAL